MSLSGMGVHADDIFSYILGFLFYLRYC